MRTYKIRYEDGNTGTAKAAGFRIEHDTGIAFYDDNGEVIWFTRGVKDVWQVPDAQEANPLSTIKSTGEPAKEPKASSLPQISFDAAD